MWNRSVPITELTCWIFVSVSHTNIHQSTVPTVHSVRKNAPLCLSFFSYSIQSNTPPFMLQTQCFPHLLHFCCHFLQAFLNHWLSWCICLSFCSLNELASQKTDQWDWNSEIDSSPLRLLLPVEGWVLVSPFIKINQSCLQWQKAHSVTTFPVCCPLLYRSLCHSVTDLAAALW